MVRASRVANGASVNNYLIESPSPTLGSAILGWYESFYPTSQKAFMKNTHSKERWEAYIRELVKSFRDLPKPDNNWTVPFIPWCGDEYWDAKPRILFVGKSVGAFNDPDAELWKTAIHDWQQTNDPDPVSLTSEYIKSKVATFKPASPAFWTIPLLITGAFIPKDAVPHQLVGALAWSNLYKVNNSGSSNGLPSKEHLKCRCDEFCLVHSSVRWLRREIEILQPDFVLLGISHEWTTIAKALSIPLKGRDPGFPVKLKDSEIGLLKLGFVPKGIWVTYHFSSWNRNCKHGRLLLEMRQALDEL
jgi:hypothetical protein